MAKQLCDGDTGSVFHLTTEFSEDRVEGWIDAELPRWDRARKG